MLSYLFGSTSESAADPLVAEGHRGLDVIINGETLRVDVDVLAQYSGLFLQVQSTNEKECPLEEFPGGIKIFRQIVNLLMESGEPAKLQMDEESVLNLFEAAWLLECPRVFDEVMQSPYIRSLSSRRQVELLENLLPFTEASNSCEGPVAEQNALEDLSCAPDRSKTAMEEYMNILVLQTQMSHRTERAALTLVRHLDMSDFVLGPRLATGSLRICLELLWLHRKQHQGVSMVSTALQPVNSVLKNLIDRPLRAKVTWDEHLFALRCIRKRLPLDLRAEQNLAGEQEEDREAKSDIPEDLCISVTDRMLLNFAELVEYVNIPRAPPNWQALLVRALVVSGRTKEAHRAFFDAFPNSPRLRLLACRTPRILPVEWLSDVAGHVEASDVLLRILGSFRQMDAEEFCDVVERVLLTHFLGTRHCSSIILPSEVMNEMVGACFDAGRKAQERQPPLKAAEHWEDEPLPTTPGHWNANGHASMRRCPNHWNGHHLLWRLANLGTRLFEAAFVAQCGFLPHKWPDHSHGEGVDSDFTEEPPLVGEARELPVRLEPLVVQVTGSCLWDEGLLEIKLLRPIMEAGCAAPQEQTLHFGQQVIMRHLWYHHNGSYAEVPQLQELWELARWPLCEDPFVLHEALEYLKGTYRELHATGGKWLPQHEEALFRMFAALDLQRLDAQALMTPYVPAQVNMVRLLVQQQPAEQFHAELQQEVLTASESLQSISSQCQKLHNKLNIVEQRTVINKSQINDAISVIEEHQRKKGQLAQSTLRHKGHQWTGGESR